VPRAFDFATGRMGGAHNLYGQILSELGTLGVLTFGALVVCFALNWLEVKRAYQNHSEWPRDFSFYVSRAIGVILVLLLLLGWSGHTLYRYNWQWFAAFQAIAVCCVRTKKLESADEPRLVGAVGQLPYLMGGSVSSLGSSYGTAHG
jgi:hypothetical protein